MDWRRDEVEKNLKALRRELTDNEQITAEMSQRRNTLKQKIQKLENQLEQLKPKKIRISDHALLRYMERHQGIAVEEVRQHMLNELKGAEEIGLHKYAGFVLQGGTVVTYVEPGTSKPA
jgi:septal ring factor EnvC (AmiA/AmiB activator)